ncbi:MAG: glycosyltransferase family 4 protein [Promethearchaeota archaeon]
MRILLITRYLFGNKAASITVRNTLRMFLAKNHSVTIYLQLDPFRRVVLSASAELVDKFEKIFDVETSPKSLIWKFMQSTLGSLILLYAFIKKAKRFQFDAVIAMYQPSTWSAFVASIISRILHVPLVVRCHDLPVPSPPGIRTSFFTELLNLPNILGFISAKKISVVSSEQKKLFSERYAFLSDKLFLLPNCVQPCKNADTSYITRKDFVVLSLESGDYEFRTKSSEILIKAISLIPDSKRKIKLLLVGRNLDLNRIKRLSNQLNLSERIQFVGDVPHQLVESIIRRSNIGVGPLVFPNGSISLRVLEFMACSKPVIAGLGCVSQDLLIDGYNGYYVQNLEPNEIAGKISLFLMEPVEEEMGKNALLQFKTNFELSVVAEKLDALLKGL